ncbi:MAG: hypothetical protein HY260_02975 [Chloroflexi bacterium]|nr:hypothetical protein [Chloroflexota bacterium]
MNLQSAFAAAYHALGYDLEVDYGRPPEIPLEEEWANRAEVILRAAGRRV